MRLVAQVRETTGLTLPLRAVFAQPTPQGLGQVLDDAASQESNPYHPLIPLNTEGTEAPLFCIHPAGGLATVYRPLALALEWNCPVYGLQARGVEEAGELFASIGEMAHGYIDAMRSVCPHGPYAILGWSFGGNVALEVARLIEQSGQTIELLILLDTRLSRINEDPVPVDNDALLVEAAINLGIDTDREVTGDALQHSVLQAMIAQNLLPDAADGAILERIKNAMLQSQRMMAEQMLPRLNCPVLFIKASDNQADNLEDRLAEITSAAIRIVGVDATHGQMCSAQNSLAMARVLNGHLRAEA
jgi:thioesterase domain-containing protein